MTEKPYTDADVKLVALTFIAEAKKNPVDPATPSWAGVQTRLLLGPTEHDIARAVLDALAAAGRLPAAHHLPLLALTAEEVDMIRALLRDLRSGTSWVGWVAPALASAMDKLAPPTPTPWDPRAAATGGGPCGTCGKPLYTHVCLSCSPDAQTPGPGCVNCRKTGMDQTPCLPPREANHA